MENADLRARLARADTARRAARAELEDLRSACRRSLDDPAREKGPSLPIVLWLVAALGWGVAAVLAVNADRNLFSDPGVSAAEGDREASRVP